jgi:hypothetical protein
VVSVVPIERVQEFVGQPCAECSRSNRSELVHMPDVVEMQRLLVLAADELEPLYAR